MKFVANLYPHKYLSVLVDLSRYLLNDVICRFEFHRVKLL